MSDIPPRHLNLPPALADELLWKILVKAEPKEHYNESRNKTRSIIMGLGYPPIDQISEFFLRYDVDRREQLTVALPPSIAHYGTRVLIESDHGIICIRVSMGMVNSRILLWNPLTGKDLLLPDDPHKHCCRSISMFGFGYLEDSMEFRIVHVFKCHYSEKKMCWSLYNSWQNRWKDDGVFESPIQKLAPKSVVHNGCVHWLG
ncbi:hypothetical protein PIB30_058940 [Stylosanthes scabra]|uniref:F-box associated beta-propeller type 1 domain-containing protein n=1 Tax=Stylosanthes scabra TaxID=79078 RepID=A0ABU6XJ27_9FABA|nr:hypothetical protein [Stylosanthes scabra]